MDNSFLAYVQKLESMAFFSGYALVYTGVLFLSGNKLFKGKFVDRIVLLLPFTYAIVGTLFLGFQIRKLYPDYSAEHIRLLIQQSYLIIWGLLPIAFWLPAFSKRPALSLIHSLFFFCLLAIDLFNQFTAPSANNDIIKNDMKVYGASMILNLGVLGVLAMLVTLHPYYKKIILVIKKRTNETSLYNKE